MNETGLRVQPIVCASAVTPIAPECLDTCKKAVEHRVLISIGRRWDRGESSDQVSEVFDLGCDTTAVLWLHFVKGVQQVIAERRA